MSNYYQKKNLSLFRCLRPGPDGSDAAKHAVIPFFLPFAGCPHRCLFCAQDKQTGQNANHENLPLSDSLAKLFSAIQAQKTAPNLSFRDLGFYGGTFTLLPAAMQSACLALGAKCKKEGFIQGVRCSTRPDALEAAQLARIRDEGLDLVEVGVQSFTNTALCASRRGYTGETALAGCQAVIEAGLGLGIQLLPGMPGSTPENFLADVQQALALKPACLRFYPCLVVRGTPLAELWQKGSYAPWTVESTVAVLGRALAAAWKNGTPVIRLSLAPEPALDEAVLAGPRHPALGSMIQGEALYLTLAEVVEENGGPPDQLCLPKRCQGFFFGHKGALRPRWQALGINPSAVVWTKDKAEASWNASGQTE